MFRERLSWGQDCLLMKSPFGDSADEVLSIATLRVRVLL